jgi:hypothetical protein
VGNILNGRKDAAMQEIIVLGPSVLSEQMSEAKDSVSLATPLSIATPQATKNDSVTAGPVASKQAFAAGSSSAATATTTDTPLASPVETATTTSANGSGIFRGRASMKGLQLAAEIEAKLQTTGNPQPRVAVGIAAVKQQSSTTAAAVSETAPAPRPVIAAAAALAAAATAPSSHRVGVVSGLPGAQPIASVSSSVLSDFSPLALPSFGSAAGPAAMLASAVKRQASASGSAPGSSANVTPASTPLATAAAAIASAAPAQRVMPVRDTDDSDSESDGGSDSRSSSSGSASSESESDDDHTSDSRSASVASDREGDDDLLRDSMKLLESSLPHTRAAHTSADTLGHARSARAKPRKKVVTTAVPILLTRATAVDRTETASVARTPSKNLNVLDSAPFTETRMDGLALAKLELEHKSTHSHGRVLK